MTSPNAQKVRVSQRQFQNFVKNGRKIISHFHIAHMLALAIEIYFLQEELYPKIDLPNIDEEILNIANLLVKTGFWKEFNYKKANLWLERGDRTRP